MTKSNLRFRKLIQQSFQLRLIGKFVGLAALALLLQFLWLGWLLSEALRGAGESAALYEQIPAIVLKTLGFSLAVLLPILFGLGVLLTHRIAGPIYRFETYLRALARGERSGPCKIRDGDELGTLRDAINQVSEHVQALEASPPRELRKTA
jgi:signal peptidase II